MGIFPKGQRRNHNSFTNRVNLVLFLSCDMWPKLNKDLRASCSMQSSSLWQQWESISHPAAQN